MSERHFCSSTIFHIFRLDSICDFRTMKCWSASKIRERILFIPFSFSHTICIHVFVIMEIKRARNGISSNGIFAGGSFEKSLVVGFAAWLLHFEHLFSFIRASISFCFSPHCYSTHDLISNWDLGRSGHRAKA